MKHILITGATGGLGYSLVEACLERSYHVTGLHGSNSERAQMLQARFNKKGSLALYKINFLDPNATSELAQNLAQAHPWDAFIHLAAPPLDLSPVTKQTLSQFETTWRITVQSAVLLTQALFSGFKKRGAGHLIYCLSSVTLGVAPKGMAAYTSAKYALWGFVRSIAAECAGTEISVNAISPGAMDTPLLRNLPEMARTQLQKASPHQQFIDPFVVSKTIIELLDTPAKLVYDLNIPILTDKISFVQP